MRAAVGMFRVTDVAAPRAETAPVASAPCATPYTSPSAPNSGVTRSVPPIRSFASPRADTPTSIRLPPRAKAGRLAVTITAATFLVCSLLSWSRVFTPSRSSIPISDCRVKTALSNLSPVPFSPTTRPYPTSWFSRMPSTSAISLIRTCAAARAGSRSSRASISRKGTGSFHLVQLCAAKLSASPGARAVPHAEARDCWRSWRMKPGSLCRQGKGGRVHGDQGLGQRGNLVAGRAGGSRQAFTMGAATQTTALANMSATAALDGLLLLQEGTDAPTRDRRARQHGRALLDALARLQLGLLGSDASPTNDSSRQAIQSVGGASRNLSRSRRPCVEGARSTPSCCAPRWNWPGGIL